MLLKCGICKKLLIYKCNSDQFFFHFVITFGWVQQQSNGKPTKKWWQNDKIGQSCIHKEVTSFKIHTLGSFLSSKLSCNFIKWDLVKCSVHIFRRPWLAYLLQCIAYQGQVLNICCGCKRRGLLTSPPSLKKKCGKIKLNLRAGNNFDESSVFQAQQTISLICSDLMEPHDCHCCTAFSTRKSISPKNQEY